MTADEAKSAVANYQKKCEVTYEVAKTGSRNKQSLSGSNFYGNKFHDSVIEMSKAETVYQKVVEASRLDDATKTKLAQYSSALKSSTTTLTQRTEAMKNLRLVCQSVLIPGIESQTASTVPVTEQVLPLSVVQNTRGYLEKVISQANGCYEHQWFDACAVMIRRFTETLIIEVYEHQGKADEIKDRAGDFLALRDLIAAITNNSTINLGRDTKKTFPLLKELGDRSAHNRRYLANKADVDKVIPGLRVVADELLHLAGLK